MSTLLPPCKCLISPTIIIKDFVPRINIESIDGNTLSVRCSRSLISQWAKDRNMLLREGKNERTGELLTIGES